MKLNKNIYNLRKAKGFSQEYMAEKLNELGISTELVRNNDISLTDEERNSIINEIKDKNDIIIQMHFPLFHKIPIFQHQYLNNNIR